MRQIAVLSALAITACTSAPRSPFEPSAEADASSIRHVVLVKLIDPQEADELIHEMDTLLAPIPGVENYWRGSPYRTDRPEVRSDYDVGLVIDFHGLAAYEAYSRNPGHVDLLTRWKPRSTSLVIYDIAPQADFNVARSKVDPDVEGTAPASPAS